MAVRTILRMGDPRLLGVCAPVAAFGTSLRDQLARRSPPTRRNSPSLPVHAEAESPRVVAGTTFCA